MTLVEVMVATSVAGMLTAGVFAFFLTNYKIGFVNQERNRINADLRSLTGQLIRDGRQANYFTLYLSTALDDHDAPGDRLSDSQSGDLLVFVDSEAADSTLASSEISRIVCYFRDSGGDDELVPVRRYERTFSPATNEDLESLIPDDAVLSGAEEVIEFSKGLADGHLFYNFWGRSVMVNGQIYHGNAAKRVTETYNFTISPRG
nr:hypothetical protein [Coraliomargarita parva]